MENIDTNKNIEENDINKENSEEKAIIKHIVISGGGPTGLTYYGVLKESNNSGVWNYKNIQSIYGTSSGAIIATIIALQYDWESIDDYLIKRPWNNLFKFNFHSILDSYNKRGIFDIKIIEEMFSPLFKGKDISIDVTMKEFYELTNIELHLFATELTDFVLIDFSYKTHPDWKVIEAIYCSSCLPILFSPYFKSEKYYCDGGLLTNYPLEQCIQNGAKFNEIFGIRRVEKESTNKLNNESNLFEYIMTILNNISKNLNSSINKKIIVPNETIIKSEYIEMYNIYAFANDLNVRAKLVNDGVEIAKNLGNS
jgi:hypothetical protein